VFHLRMTKRRSRRAGLLGTAEMRGGKAELFAGRIRYTRDRFPTDRLSLRDKNVPLTAADRLRLDRWARR
jgi:hypothetical protein